MIARCPGCLAKIAATDLSCRCGASFEGDGWKPMVRPVLKADKAKEFSFLGGAGAILVYLGLFIAHEVGIARNLEVTLVVFGVIVALLLAGQFVYWVLGLLVQKGSDATAKAVIGAELSEAYFFLYLRPFSSTGSMQLDQRIFGYFDMGRYKHDGFDDLEGVIAQAIRSTAPFVALGEPGEHRGAGRIKKSDDEWRDEVTKLAEAAALILALPAAQPGTLWELELILKRNLLSRTIFIMPPMEHPEWEPTYDVGTSWNAAKEACGKFGLLLPDYRREGLLFKLADPRTPIGFAYFQGRSLNHWRGALQYVIDARS
jgi:hypothetical protein